MSYHLTLVRMAINKKCTNKKRWRGCGEKGTLLHSWWECKLIQPLWKTVWRFPKKLGIKPPLVSQSVQSLTRVWLFATPWTAARQASLSITNSTQTHVYWVSDAIQPSLPLVPFSSCLQSFPASGSFPVSQFFPSGDQSIGVSASASILPMNTQDWFPLGWTSWISLLSKGLSRIFSNTTV